MEQNTSKKKERFLETDNWHEALVCLYLSVELVMGVSYILYSTLCTDPSVIGLVLTRSPYPANNLRLVLSAKKRTELERIFGCYVDTNTALSIGRKKNCGYFKTFI